MARRKVSKRSDSRYEKKINIGKDLDGKPIRKSFYSLVSQADADKQAEQYKMQVQAGTIVNSNILFIEWAISWLETYKKGKVSESTYITNYKSAITQHFTPFFKSVLLADITLHTLQKYFNSKSHLALSTLKKQKIALNDIFDKAIQNDLIYKNPMKAVVLPNTKPPKEILGMKTALKSY